MMLTKFSGYMLITAMVFIFLFSLMSISAVNTSILSGKISKNFKEISNLLLFSEKALKKVEEDIMHGMVNENGTLLLDTTIDTSYTVESLAIDTCTQVKGFPHTAANYYRIRIFERNISLDIPLSVEATTVLPVIQVNPEKICGKPPRQVSLGRQSWRVMD